MKELFTALAKFQGELLNIELNSSVKVATKSGGSYSFEYATLGQILNTIRPLLSKHELSFTQVMDSHAMRTFIRHSSGREIVSEVKIPSLTSINKDGLEVSMTAQEIGSVITYFRRYGLVTALGLVAEDDDDGNIATGNTVESKVTKPATFNKGILLSDGKTLVTGTGKYGKWWGYDFPGQDRVFFKKKGDLTPEDQYNALIPKAELDNEPF